MELARKMQSEIDSDAKKRSSTTTSSSSTIRPSTTSMHTGTIATSKPRTTTTSSGSSECPICTMRVPSHELEDHVNACLEQGEYATGTCY